MEAYEVRFQVQEISLSMLIAYIREARHPNVVLYLGLSRAPDPDGRIFIISEFIENGPFVVADSSLPLTSFSQET